MVIRANFQIAHPINDVLAQCMQQPQEKTPSLHPSASTISLASSTLSRHSTYSVTVHDRQRHTATEFPNANGELDNNLQTPTNLRPRSNGSSQANGHHLGLRSDPSVASLIELYDDHGRLPPEAFSNSPPSPERRERPQKKRNGSTLRELLGAPNGLSSKADSAVESDISWAERFLGYVFVFGLTADVLTYFFFNCSEAESVSSRTSSYGPHTPSTCTDAANDRTEIPKPHDLTFSTELSASIVDDPAITSMEVELSVNSDNSSILGSAAKDTNPYKNIDPNTPQRASQVFSFLTKRNTICKHPLPDPPSAFSTPSDASHDNLRSRFSTDGSEYASPGPRRSRNSCDLFKTTLETPVQPAPREPLANAEVPNDDPSELPQRKVRVLMTGPTKVIVTAPTPGTNHTPSRIPIRGPRQPPKRKSPPSRRPVMLTHRMNSANSSMSSRSSTRSKARDNFTSIPQRKPQRRTTSRGSNISTASSIAEADALATVCALDHLARSKTYHNSPSRGDKENQLSLTAKMELPATPLRSHSTSRSLLFRKVVTPGMFQPPVEAKSSPASSSELSPVGKQMMLDARKQRMRMRENERERSGRSGKYTGARVDSRF